MPPAEMSRAPSVPLGLDMPQESWGGLNGMDSMTSSDLQGKPFTTVGGLLIQVQRDWHQAICDTQEIQGIFGMVPTDFWGHCVTSS